MFPAGNLKQARERQRVPRDGDEAGRDCADQQHERGRELVEIDDAVIEDRQDQRDQQKEDGALIAAIRRRENKIEAQRHADQDGGGQAGKLEEAVADPAR